jgi:hypothetical protein
MVEKPRPDTRREGARMPYPASTVLTQDPGSLARRGPAGRPSAPPGAVHRRVAHHVASDDQWIDQFESGPLMIESLESDEVDTRTHALKGAWK